MMRQAMRAAAAVALAATVACGEAPPQVAGETSLVERSHVSMGSEVRLSAWTSDESTALAAFQRAFDEFDRLDGLMSVWKDGSDVLRVNAEAGKAPVRVSGEVLEVLQQAQQISEWTGGKFDVTFGALAGLWKFDHDRDGRIPSRAEVATRLPFIDYGAVELDAEESTVRLNRAGVSVHLGGIGKGYAVDRVVAILRADGLSDFMVRSGGDGYVGGRHGERAWRVGIQDPRGQTETLFAALELGDMAFSTSGDYERFFIRDGRRYHHILDPDTGQPAEGCRSVTVVASSSALADGLSTGIFVLGGEAGMALIERLPGVEGVIVTADNQVLVSEGLKGRLAVTGEPTDGP